VLSGTVVLLIVALIFNNMTANRQYPTNKKFTKLKKKISGQLRANKIK